MQVLQKLKPGGRCILPVPAAAGHAAAAAAGQAARTAPVSQLLFQAGFSDIEVAALGSLSASSSGSEAGATGGVPADAMGAGLHVFCLLLHLGLMNGECMVQMPCRQSWATALAQRRAWRQPGQRRSWAMHPGAPSRSETWAAGAGRQAEPVLATGTLP
jgi:hypothetical protein